MALSLSSLALIAAIVLIVVVAWVLWRKPQLPAGISLGSVAALLLAMLGGVVAMALLLRETGPLHGVVWYPTGNVVAMVSIMGALGGLLAAHTQSDRGLVWPYRHEGPKPAYDFGVLGDLLLGIAGGIVVFVTVPGDPAAKITESASEMLRFLALPVIGGFGARALLESALTQRISELERTKAENDTKLREMEEREQNTEAAKRAVQSQIEGTQLRDRTQFAALFRKLRPDAPRDLFQIADSQRSTWRQQGRRDRIARVIPILEALDDSETNLSVPELKAAIAAAYLDKKDPTSEDLNAALTAVDAAIAAAPSVPPKYQIMRALILVGLVANDPARLDAAKAAVMALAGKENLIDVPDNRALLQTFARANGLAIFQAPP